MYWHLQQWPIHNQILLWNARNVARSGPNWKVETGYTICYSCLMERPKPSAQASQMYKNAWKQLSFCSIKDCTQFNKEMLHFIRHNERVFVQTLFYDRSAQTLSQGQEPRLRRTCPSGAVCSPPQSGNRKALGSHFCLDVLGCWAADTTAHSTAITGSRKTTHCIWAEW